MFNLKSVALALTAAVIGATALQAQETITVGMANSVNQVPSLVAEAKGFFKDEGINVEIKPVSRGTIAIEAIVAGSMQFAEVSSVALFAAVDNGIPLITVGAGSRGFTGKMVGAPDMEPVSDIAELKGKKLGIQVGTGVHSVFLMLLKKQGLTENDFQISNVRVTDMPTAMASKGTFDAVLGWEPMMQRTVQAGYGKEIISADQFQKMAGITYPLILVADKNWVAEHKDATQAFVNAYARAHKWIRENPEEALKIYTDYIQAAGNALDEDIVRKMMFEVDKFGGVNFIPSDQSEFTDTRDFLFEKGQIKSKPELADIMDPSFGDAAEAKLK
ncbi:MAG: ABC transporter substrate-binding protein [Rhodobiaceae bacterium]|nr:ABC transporter substrate-binding protein [Rhodobiaceae bacterium]